MTGVTCSVSECERATHARGMCNAHYARWRRHGSTDGGGATRMHGETLDRLLAKVDKTDGGCWLWTAAVNNLGYGAFAIKGVMYRAHRVSYELLVGPIPDGLVLDHLCRVPGCVNPAHLEAVTDRVNILRGVGPSARNVRVTHCPKGHPYEGANLRIRPSGFRECRACAQASKRAARLRAKAA